jgi:DNA-binding CsgD family transcriptional regulator
MMNPAQHHLAAGQAALNVADWHKARVCFEAALQAEDSPEAHDGLGIALWWLNKIEAAHQHRRAAYVQYKQLKMLGRAAFIAAWLAREQMFVHANVSAMKGWFARAERLLSQVGPCAERGWFLIFHASMLDAPANLEQAAFQAINIAREFNDADLEAFALAFCGAARVSLGRVDAGMRDLDEAMVAAMDGEVSSFMAMSEIFCVLLSTCALAGDLERTEHWCRTAAEFAQRHQSAFLSAYCRTTYGGLLTTAGRWREAETELTEAIRAFDQGHRALQVHAILKLADLRVYQGRLEEAEVLLAGYEDYGAAVTPLARLHLARGETQLARAALEQALSSSPPMLDHLPLLTLLVDVLLAMGEVDAAKDAAEQVTALAKQTHSDLLLAHAELVQGQVKWCNGEPDAARYFQSVLERLRLYEQSLLASRARLAMARVLKGNDWAGAVTWARAALASSERIGAARDADEAAQLLRELGVTRRVGQRQHESLTQREAEVLSLVARGLTNREIADRLVISAKTVEHHVSQILGKLGLRSRAEAAAFAARSDTNISGA